MCERTQHKVSVQTPRKTVIRVLAVFALAFAVLAPVTGEAVAVPVVDVGANTALGTIVTQVGTVGVPGTLLGNQMQLCSKEVGLGCIPAGLTSWDGLAYIAAQVAVQTLTTSVLSWLNSASFGPVIGTVLSGLNQGEAFVRNYEDFLQSLADTVLDDLGNEILGVLGGNICNFSPNFRTRVANQVKLQSRKDYRPKLQVRLQCNINNMILGPVQQYFDDFSVGGWGAWFGMTQDPSQDPLAVAATLYSEGSARQTDSATRERDKLTWGQGYFAKEDCSGLTCIIKSPATAIQNEVNEAIGNSIKQISQGDEMSEIIVAFISNLFATTLQSGL